MNGERSWAKRVINQHSAVVNDINFMLLTCEYSIDRNTVIGEEFSIVRGTAKYEVKICITDRPSRYETMISDLNSGNARVGVRENEITVTHNLNGTHIEDVFYLKSGDSIVEYKDVQLLKNRLMILEKKHESLKMKYESNQAQLMEKIKDLEERHIKLYNSHYGIYDPDE